MCVALRRALFAFDVKSEISISRTLFDIFDFEIRLFGGCEDWPLLIMLS